MRLNTNLLPSSVIAVAVFPSVEPLPLLTATCTHMHTHAHTNTYDDRKQHIAYLIHQCSHTAD